MSDIKHNKKTFVIIFLGIFLIIITIIIFNSHLNKEEKYAIDKILDYKNMLKDPDSMKLRSDVIIVSSSSDNKESHKYCFFNASGNNSFGAAISSTVCYYDGKYFCDLNNTDESDYKTDANYQNEELGIFLNCKLNFFQYKLYGEKAEMFDTCSIVDCKKIAKKAKILYSE